MSQEGQLDRPQLRTAAAIALASSVVLVLCGQALPVAPDAKPEFVLLHAVNMVVALSVLGATFTRLGARHADALSLFFVLGLGANLLVYLYLLPFAVPTYPALMSNVFTCLLIAAAVLLSWSVRRMLVVGILFCAGFALVGGLLARSGFPATPFVLTLAWLAVGAALAVACARVLGRSRATLVQRQEELAALSTRLMSGQEEQVRQLSRELHDGLGQSLTAVSSYLWLIERQLPIGNELRARAADARHLVAQTLGEMRKLSQLLRPPGLEIYGLAPSVEAQVRQFGAHHALETVFDADGIPERLPAEIETAVFRICQEALTNVARHAHARRVAVTLARQGDDLLLEVRDDGSGLPAPNGNTRHGTGLIGIRERVRALHGTVSLTSGRGARLSVRLPLPPETAGAAVTRESRHG
jgi:signal transduction histidine kinase